MEKIISTAIYQIAVKMVNEQQEFNIVTTNNTKGWSPALPEALLNTDVLFNIINSDLEDSYVDAYGNVHITVGIDNVVYTKLLHTYDIHAIGYYNEGLAITKQFKEPNTTTKIIGSEKHSMNMLLKLNPHFELTPNGAS